MGFDGNFREIERDYVSGSRVRNGDNFATYSATSNLAP